MVSSGTLVGMAFWYTRSRANLQTMDKFQIKPIKNIYFDPHMYYVARKSSFPLLIHVEYLKEEGNSNSFGNVVEIGM